ncbi:MAG: helix-turn-helix transcriptional regulator [Leptolyngbya sp. SIOISBB]|nr:helix-turn-helix transcriptional regulator [Leptolyngbya sp. SIOISBB]
MKLLNRLQELDITRKFLADEVGVTERSIYRWLSYEKEPRLTVLQVLRLCTVLGWTVEELAEAYYPPEELAKIPTQSGGDYATN